ncbi:MAG: acetyl-CoA carboxylase biotin carboxyl carrier protein subunit [Ktedonobacterales bacterium]
MRYIATVDGRQHLIELEANGHLRRVTVDGRELAVDCRLIGPTGGAASAPPEGVPAAHLSVLIGDHSYEAYARAVPAAAGEEGAARTVEVHVHGYPYVVTLQNERDQALASLAGAAHVSGDATIRAPMPGLVVNVLAQPGDAVARGQTVVVLEAMKMENDLQAPRAGVVKSVRAEKGQTVAQGDALAVIGDPAAAVPLEDDGDDE